MNATKSRIIQYVRDTYGCELEYLWAKTPQNAVFRHPISRKWFAALLTLPRNKLGLPGEEPVDILNIKCAPLLGSSLRCNPGFFPAYHMNKENWVTVLLDDTVSMAEVCQLLDMGFDLISKKPKGKERSPDEMARS